MYKHYDISVGSTIITLKNLYLKTLKNGTHNIKVIAKDGEEAKTTFTIANNLIVVEENPGTSDVIMNSILLLSISIIGIIGCMLLINQYKRYN